MPQIMIDTSTDSVESLRRFATLLQDEADSREEQTSKLFESADVPAGTLEAPHVDTAAIFAKKPAGLDGHGEPAAPLAPAAPAIVPAAAPSGTVAPLAPAAPAQAPAQVGTVVLDSSGIPHDARIHQDTRKMNKDGTWQNKRGVDKALLAVVTAELLTAWSKPAAPAPLVLDGTPPPARVAASPPVAPPPPAAPPLAPPPGPVASGVAPLPPVNPPAPGGITGFRELMQKVTTNTNAGKLSNEQVDAALASVGVPPRQLIALVNQPALIPGVSAYIDACLAAG